MPSGIYLIGDGLKLTGFNEYIAPKLDDRRIIITNRMQIESHKQTNKGVLVSLSSAYKEVDLEGLLGEVLVEASDELFNLVRKQGVEGLSAYSTQIPTERVDPDDVYKGYKAHFHTEGNFDREDTASELFPGIAQKYVLRTAEAASEDYYKELEELGKKLVS